jgi:ABC-type transport system involved in multi-copper enzyme maturation permease subunit
MGAFRAALRNEFSKFARQKFPYFGLGVVVLLAVFWTPNISLMTGPNVDLNGYLVVIKGLISAVTLPIPIFACIMASLIVASETAGGTYRNVLSRPVSRFEFLTAKVLFSLAYAFALMAIFVLVAVPMTLRTYSFGPITDFGEVLYSKWRMIGIFSLACLLTFIPLAGVVCFGIMISTLAKSLSSAIGIAVVILIALEPLKQMIRIGDWQLKDYVVTSYQDTALTVADSAAIGVDYLWFPGGFWHSQLGMGLAVSLATAAVCLALSYFVFLRRDLNFS